MVEIGENGKRELAKLLARNFPNRSNLEITHIKEITEGWETEKYSLSIRYNVEDDVRAEELILRFYFGPQQRKQARKEYALMNRAPQFSIPVPRVDLLATDHSPFGDAFIVMERIRGETMATTLDGASEPEILTLMRMMVTHFVTLHQIPWQQLFDNDQRGIPAHHEPMDFIRSQLTDMRTTVFRYRLHEFDPFLRWLDERAELGATTRLCVIHNDYHPLNIMVRESNGGLVILDWSFADVGDYRLDLAWSVLLVSVMVGDLYGEIMVKLYEEIAGARVEHFQYFEVLKFTARILTIASWLDESVVIPVKKITREAIRNEYKVHVLNVYNRLKEITDLELPSMETL